LKRVLRALVADDGRACSRTRRIEEVCALGQSRDDVCDEAGGGFQLAARAETEDGRCSLETGKVQDLVAAAGNEYCITSIGGGVTS